MKIRIFTPLLLTTILLSSVSCKDDEPGITATLTGKWQGDLSELKVTYGIITIHEEEDDQFDAVLDFRDNGTVTFTEDGTTTSGTYQLNGNKLTTNVELQVQGVELTTATFDVVELSTTKLRLHLEQEQEVEVPDVGMVTTDIEGDFAFDRL